MSKVLVSNDSSLETPEGFYRYTSIQAIPQGTAVEDFIFHRAEEDTAQVIEKILELASGVKHFYYVVDEDKMDSDLKVFFISLKARVEYDEIFIREGIFLRSLLDNSSGEASNALAIPTSTVDIVKDFLDKVDRGEAIRPPYLKALGTASKDLLRSHDEASGVLERFSNSHLNSLRGLSDKIAVLTDNQQKAKAVAEEAWAKLKKIEEQSATKFTGRGGGVIFFPPVVYNNAYKVAFVIKEINSVPYTTSFILGFRWYLTKVHRKNVRLLIVVPPGRMLETKYSNIEGAFFADRSVAQNRVALQGKDLVVTNHPTASILGEIASSEEDILLVLDKTANDINPIYKRPAGKGKVPVRVWYSVASQRDKDLFIRNKQPKTYISSMQEVKGAFLKINEIEGFSKLDIATKYRTYAKVFEDQYRAMYQAIMR